MTLADPVGGHADAAVPSAAHGDVRQEDMDKKQLSKGNGRCSLVFISGSRVGRYSL